MIATTSKPIRKRRQTRARRPRRTGSVYAKPFIDADFSPRVQYGPNLYAGYYASWLGMDPRGTEGEKPGAGTDLGKCDPSKFNCFGYCFGLEAWWGNPEGWLFVVVDSKTKKPKGRFTSILCSKGDEVRKNVAAKAKELKLTNETKNTDCCCGKEKICVYTESTLCVNLSLDELKKHQVQDRNGIPYFEIPDDVLAKADAKQKRVDLPQHCVKCSYPNAQPPGSPKNWSEKLGKGPIKDYPGSTLPNERQIWELKWKIWNCFETDASSKVTCNKSSSGGK